VFVSFVKIFNVSSLTNYITFSTYNATTGLRFLWLWIHACIALYYSNVFEDL